MLTKYVPLVLFKTSFKAGVHVELNELVCACVCMCVIRLCCVYIYLMMCVFCVCVCPGGTCVCAGLIFTQ